MDYKENQFLKKCDFCHNKETESFSLIQLMKKEEFNSVLFDFINYCEIQTISMMSQDFSNSFEIYLPIILHSYFEFSYEMKIKTALIYSSNQNNSLKINELKRRYPEEIQDIERIVESIG